MNEPFRSSARTTSELLHAEVAYLMREADIPVLHIKGPTVAQWLYADGERSWGDVDILVPKSRLADCLRVLRSAGFEERFTGVDERTSRDHAITMSRREPGVAGHGPEVDVHQWFEGIDLCPDDAFELLWSRRVTDDFAHVDAWVPDLPSRALILVLNTARSRTEQSLEDLRRVIASADDDDWAEVVGLAHRLRALPGLRAGLSLDPSGQSVIDRFLPNVQISPEWSLRLKDAPRTALRLDELRRMAPAERLKAIAYWVAPPPAIVRMRAHQGDEGRISLARAYFRRLADGARALPSSVRDLSRALKESRSDMRNSDS